MPSQSDSLSRAPQGPTQAPSFKYYDLIMVAFVTMLLCSNLIGTTNYLFGDILTEVYGYRRSRKVVWAGFTAMIFACFVCWVVIHLPPAPGWDHQAEIEFIFGQTPRLVFGSLIAYFVGELSNSYVLAKMKVRTQGKQLWARFILSTIIGEGIDTLIFYPLAFYKFWPDQILIRAMFTSYCFKVLWEVVMIPFTYKIVNYLKRIEGVDYYDYDTDFSVFSLRT
jgi:queuosine precursor transporter